MIRYGEKQKLEANDIKARNTSDGEVELDGRLLFYNNKL